MGKLCGKLALRNSRTCLGAILLLVAFAAISPTAANAGRYTVTTSRGGWCDLDNFISPTLGAVTYSFWWGMVANCHNVTKTGGWAGSSFLRQRGVGQLDSLGETWSNGFWGAPVTKKWNLAFYGAQYDVYSDISVGLNQTKPVETFLEHPNCFVRGVYGSVIDCFGIYQGIKLNQ